MNDTPSTSISRRRLLEAAGAAAAVAAVGLARPTAAASPSPMPFQATLKGSLASIPVVNIPVQPPVESITENVRGQSDLLGPFQWVAHFLNPVSVDGSPEAATGGIGAMTGAHGDALFFTFSGSARTASPGVKAGELLFTITGGSGRFLGAIGSGSFTDTIDLNKGAFTRMVQGVLIVPG